MTSHFTGTTEGRGKERLKRGVFGRPQKTFGDVT